MYIIIYIHIHIYMYIYTRIYIHHIVGLYTRMISIANVLSLYILIMIDVFTLPPLLVNVPHHHIGEYL